MSLGLGPPGGVRGHDLAGSTSSPIGSTEADDILPDGTGSGPDGTGSGPDGTGCGPDGTGS
eukprot:4436427-Karenia_brevis.AAC.1